MIVTNWLLVRAYVLRGAILWLLARALVSMVMALADADPFAVSVRSSVIIILVTTALGFAQTLRLREGVLLRNLGLSPAMLALYFALPGLVGELIIGATGAAFS